MTHAWFEVLAQRISGIGCGYPLPDTSDADGLADDPMQKLLLDRDPIAGGRLASQSAVPPRALYALGEALTDTVTAGNRQRQARRVTIDLDVTEDATHGAQQLTFFNGF